MLAGDLHVQLTSRTLRVRLPLRNHAEMSWSQPVCVTWQRGHSGKRTVMPIIDITRLAQVVILASTFVGILLCYKSVRQKQLTPGESTGDNNDTGSRAERQ
jgi:hypothetical protein